MLQVAGVETAQEPNGLEVQKVAMENILAKAHHQSYEACWRARLDRRWSGRFWRWLYGFHQAHHANHRCNLNVAGFFGIPLVPWKRIM